MGMMKNKISNIWDFNFNNLNSFNSSKNIYLRKIAIYSLFNLKFYRKSHFVYSILDNEINKFLTYHIKTLQLALKLLSYSQLNLNYNSFRMKKMILKRVATLMMFKLKEFNYFRILSLRNKIYFKNEIINESLVKFPFKFSKAF